MLLERCLEKDAVNRYHDMADARLDVQDALANPDGGGSQLENAQAEAPSRLPWVAAIVLTAVVVAIGTRVLRPLPPPAPVARFSVAFEEGQAPIEFMELTADGSALVYVGPGESGEGTQLWLRRWADFEATPIRGTEGAESFALSPDEREVAFAPVRGPLRVVSLSGGPGRTLLDGVGVLGDWASERERWTDLIEYASPKSHRSRQL